MDKMIGKWFQCVIYHIVFRSFCSGVITLAPRNVPWENEQWNLECSLDSIVSSVSINNPSSSTVGTCDPTSGLFPAYCTSSAGYTFAINETSNIVSMTVTVGNSETGTWTCLHSTDSATYNLQSPLPSRHLAASLSSYEKHFMSVPAGTELTRGTVYNFSAHSGCMSTTLKFVWTTVPGSSFEDISNTNSNSFTCTTKSAYMSTIDTTATILQSVNSVGTKLKVSVYVAGYYSLPSAAEYTYDVTFAPSKSETTTDDFAEEQWVPIFLVCLIVVALVVVISYKLWHRNQAHQNPQNPITPPPKVTIDIPYYECPKGYTVKLIAVVVSDTPVTNICWQKKIGNKLFPIKVSDNKPKYRGSSKIDPSLTICDVCSIDSGNYRCFATNSSGKGESTSTATLSVIAKAQEYKTTVGSSVDLLASLCEIKNVTYVNWEHDREQTVILEDGNGLMYKGGIAMHPSLTIRWVSREDVGTWRCFLETETSRSVIDAQLVIQEKLLYFAYGCNLLKKRIHSINPSAVNIGIAKLMDFRLDFVSIKDPEKSSWLGGIAALKNDASSHVWGTLWKLDVKDERSLEEQHKLYKLTEIDVTIENTKQVVCKTLMLTQNKVQQQWVHTPSHHYKAVLINGALESGLPRDYIQELLLIPVNDFPEQFEEEADI